MTRLRAIALFACTCLALCPSLRAQSDSSWEIQALHPESGVIYQAGEVTFTNGVRIRHSGAVLTADRVTVNQQTGEAVARGHVRIEQNNEIWTGQQIQFNFKTHQMISSQFRTGKTPVYAAGHGLHGDITNHVYDATNAFVTTDDIHDPAFRVRVHHIRIIPGRRIVATGATLYFGRVPVFYFPYYSRNLGPRANNFNFTPGYRSYYGPFLLGNYTWFLGDRFDGKLRLDYRQKRGVGTGPDFNFHLGRWGDGTFTYYYTYDDQPGTNAAINAPVFHNRQRLYFAYQGEPFRNTEIKSLVRYQSDAGVLHDFFEGEYANNPQPNTFFNVRKFWQNFSLNTLAQPRVDNFYQTVERLPEVRLTGFRQEIGNTPLYYESESSAGYYRRLFAETNGPVPPYYQAARADTYHKVLLPETFFGWLNVTPRVGGRFTYYSKTTGPGGSKDEASRGVFNTGAEVSFKASRLWPGLRSRFLNLDGVRHIVVPSVNYVFVPSPNVGPDRLPQFDTQLPSLRLLPIEFPQYNSIDAIDSENAIRFGLNNRLQTKRHGRVQDFLDWEVQTDWRLQPRAGQPTFSDVYSDLTFRPRSWISFGSLTRFDPNNGDWRMALHTLTLQPNDVWSWTIGHFFLRDDLSGSPTALGAGNNLLTSTLFYRANENWCFRATHIFDARHGRMQEQDYTVYRDLRSWTAALTVGLRDNGSGPNDLLVAFTFSLKAMPRFGLGSDTVSRYSLLGSEPATY